MTRAISAWYRSKVREPLSGSDRSAQRYWESYLRLGFVVFLLESGVALGYFACARVVPHRELLVVAASLGSSFSIVAFFWSPRISSSAHRARHVSLVNAGSSILLTVAVILDGGLASPLLYLLVLPMMAAALALPPRSVALLGALSAAEVTFVSATDHDVLVSTGRLILQFALLIGVLILSVGSSIGRDRLQREEAELVDELSTLARTDSLTGCLNHGAFYERLTSELSRAERHHDPLSLVVADVDLFKSFNDRKGHGSGDRQLVAVASLLRDHARVSDVVARIGGDEFSLILPQTSLAEAELACARISRALHEDPSISVTLSLGVACLDPSEPTTTRLFRDADAALYEAKALGRDRVQASHRQEGSEGFLAPLMVDEDRDRLRDQLSAVRHQMAEAVAVAQALQDAAPTGLAFVDQELRLLQINPALAAAVGMRPDELRGRRLDEALPDQWRLLEPILGRVLTNASPEEFETTLPPTSSDAEPRTWHAYLFPVDNDDGVIGAGTVMIDVTDALRAADAQRSTTEHVVAALAAASEMRDPYTSGHQERVGQIATAVARELGLDEEHVQDIGLAARIHDIGKVGVPSEILTKPGLLSGAELALVRTHTELGDRLLRQVHFPDRVAEIVRHHHERLDGSGYPDQLRGDEVSIGARIVAVADVAEAVASRRPYRAAQGLHAAMEVLAEESTVRLDATVVAALVRLINEGRVELREDAPNPGESPRDASRSPRRSLRTKVRA